MIADTRLSILFLNTVDPQSPVCLTDVIVARHVSTRGPRCISFCLWHDMHKNWSLSASMDLVPYSARMVLLCNKYMRGHHVTAFPDKMLKIMKLMLRVYVSERTELSRDPEKNWYKLSLGSLRPVWAEASRGEWEGERIVLQHSKSQLSLVWECS